MSKRRKSSEAQQGVTPVGGDCDEGDELTGDLVDDDVAGIFAAGFAGDDGGGGNADQRDDDGGDDCGDGQRERGDGKEVGGEEPEDDGGDRAVSSGTGLEQAGSEEGADDPGPKCLFFSRRMDLDIGVGHGLRLV